MAVVGYYIAQWENSKLEHFMEHAPTALNYPSLLVSSENHVQTSCTSAFFLSDCASISDFSASISIIVTKVHSINQRLRKYFVPHHICCLPTVLPCDDDK